MSSSTALRLLALCLMRASGETLHGIARTVLVVPRIGKERAPKWSTLTGSGLALPYLMAIAALVLVARRAAYPQALMKPYRKGER